ncbi:MAG: class I SAM-dependent methyltransferase [Streptosporangiales bacterium]
MTHADPDEEARRLAAASLDVGDPTGWFDRLYGAAERGDAVVPWDRGQAHPLLVEWAAARGLSGAGRPALVVGFGPGHDAEFVSSLGFDTVAFDVAETAVEAVRRRFPGSSVRYRTGDLLDPPPVWRRSFDLVVESYTVQSLPEAYRHRATTNVAEMVAPGGTLIVIGAVGVEGAEREDGPPWPLVRTEVEAFSAGGLSPVLIEDIQDATTPTVRRWRAEFHRA